MGIKENLIPTSLYLLLSISRVSIDPDSRYVWPD